MADGDAATTSGPPTVPAFTHRLAVRYGEVDQQGVVFNAHYLAYCDDAMETWLRTAGLDVSQHGWDFMLKKASIEWTAGAGVGDLIDIDVGVQRWGRTSFDVAFDGRVGSRPLFTCVITYVGVRAGTLDTQPPPAQIRTAMELPGPERASDRSTGRPGP